MPGTSSRDRRAERQAALAAILDAEGLDALLVTSRPNIRYLTGFSGSAGVAVVNADDDHAAYFRQRAGARRMVDFGLRRGMVGGGYVLKELSSELRAAMTVTLYAGLKTPLISIFKPMITPKTLTVLSISKSTQLSAEKDSYTDKFRSL